MAGYGGYFLSGLAGGLKSGFQMGQQAQEMKWQKAQRKKLEDQQNKIMESATIFNNLVSQLGEDGNYSEDDIWKINTAYMALGYEVQERVQGSHKAIQAMDKNRVEQNNEWFGYAAELTLGMNAEDAQGIFDIVRGFVKGEKALERYTAYENILKKKSEVLAAQPTIETFPTAEAVTEAYPEAGFKHTAGGYVPTFQKPEALPTELDRVAETEKWLDAAYATGNATYFNRIAKERGSPATFETYKQKYKPEIEPPPEGEITAGEKRTYDMASSVLFGSSDFVTGISKPGIISSMISSKLNMGQPLIEEEKTEVRNNYNLIKGTLPSEVISHVESQLQRYGIPLEAPITEPTITPEPEPKKWWEFWKERTPKETMPITPEIKPSPEILGEPLPELPKVPTEKKEALIPTMSDKELHDTLMNTDPSDPIYKILYDEAVKRGLIIK